MADSVKIYESLVPVKKDIVTAPARFIIMITEKGRKPYEFVDGGVITRESARLWCYDLADTNPNITELCIYELDRKEYAERMK